MVGLECRGFWFCSKECRKEHYPFYDPEKEAEEKRRKALEKSRKESEIPKLSILDAGQLALRVSKEAALEEALPVIKILTDETQIHRVLQDLNDKLVAVYTEEIEALYKAQGISCGGMFYDLQLKTDLDQCMALGMNSIEKKLGLERTSDSQPGDVAGRKIEKTRSWKEIKKDLK
jgi:rRNA maturation endonuclease Nob1